MTLDELNQENLALHRSLATAKLEAHQLQVQLTSMQGIVRTLTEEREAAQRATPPADHELFTHALFVDAIVGVGFPNLQVEREAHAGGLTSGGLWSPEVLQTLPLVTLQELYVGLKNLTVGEPDQPAEGPLVWTPQGSSHAHQL